MVCDRQGNQAGAVSLPVAGADVATLLPMMDDFNAGEQIAVEATALRRALDRLLGDAGVGRVWLIRSGSDTVGYAVVTFGYDLEFAGRDAFITELYLQPSARGRGIGRIALASIEKEANALGIRAIHLMVRPDNEAAAALYASAGYRSPLASSCRRLWFEERLATHPPMYVSTEAHMQGGTPSPGGRRPIMHAGVWVRLTLMMAALWGSACGKHLGEPPRTPPVLGFQPEDQRSDVGDGALEVRLTAFQDIDAQLVSRVAAGAELVRWPEMTNVAVQTDVSCCDPPGHGPGGGTIPAAAAVLLRPLAPLEPSRWYALAVAPQAHKMTTLNSYNGYLLPDGRAVARFALDGPASVAAIRICDKQQVRSVYIDFSEPVLVGSQAPGSVVVEQDGTSCPSPLLPIDRGTTDEMPFHCNGGSGWRNTKIVFRDLTAPSGEVVTLAVPGGTRRETSAALDIAITDAHQVVNDCWRVKLDL